MGGRIEAQPNGVGSQSSAPDLSAGNGSSALTLASGAIAQLGERLNGIQEVVGSIPIGSTKISYILQ